jgi:hypothetical protein
VAERERGRATRDGGYGGGPRGRSGGSGLVPLRRVWWWSSASDSEEPEAVCGFEPGWSLLERHEREKGGGTRARWVGLGWIALTGPLLAPTCFFRPNKKARLIFPYLSATEVCSIDKLKNFLHVSKDLQRNLKFPARFRSCLDPF